MKRVVPAFVAAAIFLSGVNAQTPKKEKLVQTVTKSLPADLKAYVPAEHMAMVKGGKANAVIVKEDKEGSDKSALEIQKSLKKNWKVEFPIVDWATAQKSDKNLILYGNVNANTPLRQLNANFILGNNTLGYELRTIFNALDWKKDVIYIGGDNDQDIKEALAALTEKIKDPSKIPFFVSCKGWDKKPDEKALAVMVSEVKKHYQNNNTYVLSQVVISQMLKKPALLYKMTGDDAYAKTFAQMQQVMFDNFGKTRNGNKEKIPTFTFHLYPQYLYLVENSPAFTTEDRLKAAEFIRKIVEETMAFWEMKKPLSLYAESTQDYLTNHSCFASRSVSSSARYLSSRYDYAPAKFWIAVADNAFAGVAPHPFSPEDAAGYQYLVYQIFIDYALASGTYDLDFFKNPTFVSYLNFSKFQLNHLGFTAGFGDANPIGHNSAYPILKQSMDILGDKESEYIIDLIEKRRLKEKKVDRGPLTPPGKHTLGLSYQEVVPFKQERYDVANYYKRPTLDKAVFRSGWDQHADFLSITGINGDGYNHSHFDANGISQYISGDRLWLWEGDYIKKFPNDHNSIVVNKDGKLPDQSRSLKRRYRSSLSQILAVVNTTDRNFSLISLLLEGYNGINWTRNINYAAKNGFWVIDEMDIMADGHYITEVYWRSTGTMTPESQSVKIVQKKSDDKNIANHFFITEGNGANRFTKTTWEAGHGRKDGNLSGYAYSDKSTKYVIQRMDGDYKKGDKKLFVNFLQAIPGAAPKAPVIRRLTPTVFLAESNGVSRLAVINNYAVGDIEIMADACFIGPEGIVARGATRIKVGNFDWKSTAKVDTALDLSKNLNVVQLNQLLAKAASKSEVVAPKPSTAIAVTEGKITNKDVYKSPITVTASAENHFAIGLADGLFMITDSNGKGLASHQFPKAISAITSVKTPSGLFWAVALLPRSTRTGESKLYYLNSDAQVVWEKTMPAYHNRNGTIKTLFTANAGQMTGPDIIAGAESWHYYAFSTSGKELWKQRIFHSATVGAAGDMDGDGIDEIAAGSEYYYHSIIQKGKVLPHKVTSPSVYSLAITDLNNDGLKEAVYGRGDGFLYVEAVAKNPVRNWRLNIGGTPTSIVEITDNVAKIAVSNTLGDIVFVDGNGKTTNTVHLPAGLTDMKVWKGQLVALCVDGYVYAVDFKGNVLSKYKYSFDNASIYEAKLAVNDKAVMAFSGKETIVIN